MNRLWSRVGIRATSVGLLAAGVAGGLYLGQDREVQQSSAQTQDIIQVNVDEEQLLKLRQGERAAARSWQREAEGDAAAKAANEAKAAAGRAHTLEVKAIADQKAAKVAADKKAAKDQKAAADQKAATQNKTEKASGGPVPYTGSVPSSCNEFSGSRQIGCSLMMAAGFGIDQFPCLDNLYKKESGWNYRASNRSSGAYGIPQALPGSKMASAGSDWETNPATQIKWGLSYIQGRYDSPCGAWSHSQNSGWY